MMTMGKILLQKSLMQMAWKKLTRVIEVYCLNYLPCVARALVFGFDCRSFTFCTTRNKCGAGGIQVGCACGFDEMKCVLTYVQEGSTQRPSNPR